MEWRIHHFEVREKEVLEPAEVGEQSESKDADVEEDEEEGWET